ncbi:hypothetical protein Tco_0672592 [Tanacetum coccineum]
MNESLKGSNLEESKKESCFTSDSVKPKVLALRACMPLTLKNQSLIPLENIRSALLTISGILGESVIETGHPLVSGLQACTKHMPGNRSNAMNFCEIVLGYSSMSGDMITSELQRVMDDFVLGDSVIARYTTWRDLDIIYSL